MVLFEIMGTCFIMLQRMVIPVLTTMLWLRVTNAMFLRTLDGKRKGLECLNTPCKDFIRIE